jgi:hypothetical protein
MARMRHLLAILGFAALALPACTTVRDSDMMRMLTTRGDWRGSVLSDMTWVEARERLTPETIIVLPLGAAA